MAPFPNISTHVVHSKTIGTFSGYTFGSVWFIVSTKPRILVQEALSCSIGDLNFCAAFIAHNGSAQIRPVPRPDIFCSSRASRQLPFCFCGKAKSRARINSNSFKFTLYGTFNLISCSGAGVARIQRGSLNCRDW